MQKKSKYLVLIFALILIACNHNINDDSCNYEENTDSIIHIQYPHYFYWNTLTDSTKWVPFRYLPYCGMRLDSIKKILGEPDFVSGCKMNYGLDKYGSQGCDIAPMFKKDSCAIVYEYIWQYENERIQTILFFEATHTQTNVDTPLWGFRVNLDKVMLE